MNNNPCELDGTCDDADPTIAEFCASNPDAPFCSGASMKECVDGTEVPEDQMCPIESTVTQAPEPQQTLPNTGFNDGLLGGSLLMVVLGTTLIRFVKNVSHT